MNKALITGRLTRDVETRYTQGNNTCIAKYTIAVDRRFKREGEPDADFIPCIAFGKLGEFAEKWFQKGMKVEVSGRIKTGSYTNKEGFKVYTTDVIVEEQGFAESKNASGNGQMKQVEKPKEDGFDQLDDDLPFMDVADDLDFLPFK